MADSEKICPLMGGACVKERCMWWVHVRGKHPQKNAELDLQDCAVSWLPVLMLETNKEVREAAAAVESFRNLSAKSSELLLGMIHQAANRPLPPAPLRHAVYPEGPSGPGVASEEIQK